MHTFRDLETAVYCPRKLYYRRRAGDTSAVPDGDRPCRELAFEYERLLANTDHLREAPIVPTPTQYRSRLGRAKARLNWQRLVDPVEHEVVVTGRECCGIVDKLLAGPTVSLVFTGRPPAVGVRASQSVRLVAAAMALAHEYETTVDTTVAEYPAYGVIRPVDITPPRRAAYHEALAVADAVDGPPSRTQAGSKCKACAYSGRCGVRTRSLTSLLDRS
ncbi:MAG: hypothetical protein J07HX5_01352 [halophilic archaeon J07HX5]|nr:MAG: hypothetical protein J07HX5_01352 [halophilic archaeon J07HX5]